jgi:hypothetical protein
VRRKYDGKEIIVRGYTLTAATLSHEGHDEGSVWLEETGRNASRQEIFRSNGANEVCFGRRFYKKCAAMRLEVAR